MTDGFDQLLKETLSDLSEEGRPVNLAAAALRQGRRSAVRRRSAAMAICAAVVALVALPFGIAGGFGGQQSVDIGGPDDGPQSGASAAPEPSVHPSLSIESTPVILPGRLVLASIPHEGSTIVYARTDKRYRTVPYQVAAVAPTGTLVAVQRVRETQIGLLDLATDKVSWISGPTPVSEVMEWSSDGTRLLYAGRSTATSVQAVVIDVPKAVARTVTESLTCSEKCSPHWLPGDKEIGFNQLTAETGWRIRAYPATGGSPTRDIPLPGEVLSSHAWSPDGRYVIVSSSEDIGADVVEISNGRTIGHLGITSADLRSFEKSVSPSATRIEISDPAQIWWATDDRLLSAAISSVIQYSADGSKLDVFPLAASMSKNFNGYPQLAPVG